MNSGLAAAKRLTGAIEKFFALEAVWIKAGDCSKAAFFARRATPLIVRLGEIGAAEPGVRSLIAPRVVRLLAKRQENRALLAERRKELDSERRRIFEAKSRLSEFAPVYGRRTPPRRLKLLNAAV